MASESAIPNVSPVSPGPGAGRGRSGCLVALVILLVILLGLSVLLNLALLGLKKRGEGLKKPEPMRQEWVAGEGEKKICLVDLSGVIMEEVQGAGLFGLMTKPVERIARELEAAGKDEDVRAVVLSIDSPGGTVSASDGIWHAVTRFKETSKKPVVVWMGAVCASGGYYVASSADELVASPTTITGSIGVIMSTFNFSGLLTKFDIQNITIKSGANKDLLNPFQPIKEEQIGIIQGMIDSAYDLFLKRVADGRAKAGLAPNKVRELADGRIYTAEQALADKLVDKIGYRDAAFDEAKSLASLTEATVFRYVKQPSFLDVLAGDASADARVSRSGPLDLSLETILSLETPRLLYLWMPGSR